MSRKTKDELQEALDSTVIRANANAIALAKLRAGIVAVAALAMDSHLETVEDVVDALQELLDVPS